MTDHNQKSLIVGALLVSALAHSASGSSYGRRRPSYRRRNGK